MKVSFFIDRPVFSAVISIVIVIVGIIGLTMLPVDQYPQITPPVVKISASYPGASALTVSQAVATPIEQEINGTPRLHFLPKQDLPPYRLRAAQAACARFLRHQSSVKAAFRQGP